MRTQPTSTDIAARTSEPEPRTNSVEPPPMSTSRRWPAGSGSVAAAPVKERRASSSPEMTSGAAPSTEVTIAVNSWAFAASRVAEVATMRTASAPCSRIRAV